MVHYVRSKYLFLNRFKGEIKLTLYDRNPYEKRLAQNTSIETNKIYKPRAGNLCAKNSKREYLYRRQVKRVHLK